MSKYVKEFKLTGCVTVHVDLICKKWNDKFCITTWTELDKSKRYTFVVNGKRKNSDVCKVQISKEQADEIVSRLGLVYVKNYLFNSAGAYHSINFCKSEIDRIKKIKIDKERELDIISRLLYQYEKSV